MSLLYTVCYYNQIAYPNQTSGQIKTHIFTAQFSSGLYLPESFHYLTSVYSIFFTENEIFCLPWACFEEKKEQSGALHSMEKSAETLLLPQANDFSFQQVNIYGVTKTALKMPTIAELHVKKCLPNFAVVLNKNHYANKS